MREKIGVSYKTYKSNSCGEFFVIARNSSTDLTVMFLDTGSKVKTTSSQVGTGEIKDPMSKSVFGVGFIGVGGCSLSKNKIAGLRWRAMMERCYSSKSLKRRPTYSGVTVCDEWHNFQNFAEWFEDNYPRDGGGWHLDKDILSSATESKEYSPETCLFVTQAENNRQSAKDKKRRINPLKR